jgi:DNA-3-methyladenine glycosylase I
MQSQKKLTPSLVTLNIVESTINALKKRCCWVALDKQDYIDYHDLEWGVPVHNDNKHFEMLILEGAQAGLSWYTILKRRQAYRKVFKQFDPHKVAIMSDAELESILTNTEIIRNKLKIFATRKNARIFITIQQEFGSFDNYIWQFVDGKAKPNLPKTIKDLSSHTLESDILSKDLKKRGMSFVGSTIIYAYMQATGMVNDHMEDCFVHQQISNNLPKGVKII